MTKEYRIDDVIAFTFSFAGVTGTNKMRAMVHALISNNTNVQNACLCSLPWLFLGILLDSQVR